MCLASVCAACVLSQRRGIERNKIAATVVNDVVAWMQRYLSSEQGEAIEGWSVELAEWVPSDAKRTQCGSPASFRGLWFKSQD